MDRRQVLQAPRHLGAQTGLGQALREDVDHLLDVGLARAPLRSQPLLELARRLRLEGPEGQILELLLHPVDAQPVGERDVDVEGLLRDATLGVLRHVPERAHVVEAVGQLDEQDADVLGHRDQHLAEVLGLSFTNRGELDAGDLGEALDQEADLLAEAALDLVGGGEGVLDGVVQQPGRDRHLVHAHLDQDARHLDRVDQVGLAGEPLLALVDLGREDVGAFEQGEVAGGIVLEDAVRDVVEAQRRTADFSFGIRHLHQNTGRGRGWQRGAQRRPRRNLSSAAAASKRWASSRPRPSRSPWTTSRTSATQRCRSSFTTA